MATAPIIDVPISEAPTLTLVVSNDAPARLPLSERVTIAIAGILAIVVVLMNAQWIAEAWS